MHHPIQSRITIRSRASALQIIFSITLIFAFGSLLASASVETPTLGNYPNTSLSLSTDTTVTPDAAPTGTTSITVSTSTDFKGTFAWRACKPRFVGVWDTVSSVGWYENPLRLPYTAENPDIGRTHDQTVLQLRE